MFGIKNIFSILFDELWARPDQSPDFAKCVTCDIDFYDCQYITNDNYLVSGQS